MKDYIFIIGSSGVGKMKTGFIQTELDKTMLVFGKENVAKQLLITKEMYFNNKVK